MQRVFKMYPETRRAREDFEREVKKTEEEVRSRKVEILKLKAAVADLKLKREFVLRTSAPAPEPAAAPSTGPADSAAASTPSLSALPGMTPPEPAPVEVVPSTSQIVEAALAAPSSEELDRQIAEKTRELAEKETAYRAAHALAERKLLELESRKTEILLGKIYKVVQDVARQEGVSVVVDKSQILFGHNAMDLTERVLQKL